MKNSKPSQPVTPPTPTKVIEVGKFYLIHDGSKTGHPGLIIWKDDFHNLYLAIKFGSSSSKENIKFTYPLSKDITTSYYYKRLFLGKRRNFGSIELTKLSILDKDLSDLIKTFDYLNPKYSKDLNSKDRYQYKRGIKKGSSKKRGVTSFLLKCQILWGLFVEIYKNSSPLMVKIGKTERNSLQNFHYIVSSFNWTV